MLFELNDVVSATEAGRSAPRYFRDAGAGRRFIVFKDNQPQAAIIGMDDFRRLCELDATTARSQADSQSGSRRKPDAAQILLDDLGISDLRTWSPEMLWYNTLPDAGVIATLGIAADAATQGATSDPVSINLSGIREHPPGLVAGGTGPHGCAQGLTETGVHGLNVMFALSLCARYAPERVKLVLVDLSEAAESRFDDLEALPHTIKYLTAGNTSDIGAELDDLISAQIEERKLVLAEASAKTSAIKIKRYSDMLGAGPRWRASEVFFIVSGGRQYFYENRKCLSSLTRLAGVGGDLGMHLHVTDSFIDETLYGELMEHMSYGISFRVKNAHASRVVVKTDAPMYFEPKDGLRQALLHETHPGNSGSLDSNNLTRMIAFDPEMPAPGMGDMSIKDALIDRIVAYHATTSG